MSKLNPPPQTIPKSTSKDARGFVQSLLRSIYQIFDAIGGGTGVPKIFDIEGTPTAHNSTAPDGFVKININGEDKFIPYWNA